MPLRWRSSPKFDGAAAGERSPAGQEEPVANARSVAIQLSTGTSPWPWHPAGPAA